MSEYKPILLIIVLAVAGYFLPALLGGSGAIYGAFVLIAIFAVMAYGLDLIVSDLGEVSLAHPVFFAAGAYTTAILSVRLGMGPFATLLGTIFVAMALALIIGLITLRLREFVFSLVTYAVTVVAYQLAQNWSFLGGSDGITGIPLFQISFAGFQYTAITDRDLWPLAFLLLLVTIYLVSAFRRSRLGKSAMTVHLNTKLAVMSGTDPQRTRLYVFLVSAPITAAAGWLYTYQRAYISADILSPYFLILMLTAVVLVGRGYLLAPLAGIAIIMVQEKFFSFGGYVDRIILGCALVVTLAFLPGGLVGAAKTVIGWFGRRPAATPIENKT